MGNRKYIILIFVLSAIIVIGITQEAYASSEATIYIQFGTDTLVKHGISNCQGSPNDLDLEGDVDANFKVGDILVLDWFPSEPQRWIEVHRDQT